MQSYAVTQTCWQCRGTGASRYQDAHGNCGVCHGTGKVPEGSTPQNPAGTPQLFAYEANADGYMIFYKGKPLGGAVVKRSDDRPRHWKHTRQNVKDFDEQARAEIEQLKHGGGQAYMRDVIARIDGDEPKKPKPPESARIRPTTKLRTESNTPEMSDRIQDAANDALRDDHPGPLTVAFEHGQHWVTCGCGAQWSANDAEGTIAQGVFDGFCFEQVSQGEEGFHDAD